MSAVVIIPTTGDPKVRQAIQSVLDQTYITKAYVVCDGFDAAMKFGELYPHANPEIQVCRLPENVGANGFYGHRVYASFPHLVNEDYVLFLDQDCWFDENHVRRCVELIESKDLQWCYSLRKICDKDGSYLLDDNCESLGKWINWTNSQLIDTNTYCIKREYLVRLASTWHGGWGQDRVFYQTLAMNFGKYECTKKHSVFYRLAGNEGSVTKEFFQQGNAKMMEKYGTVFPWNE
jgi:glycosyltransferase involved in cell wall biosynthesis